jgi:DNA-binding MarR family transcriptional regulator
MAVTRAMDRDLQAHAGLAIAEHHLLAVINEAGENGIRPTDLALVSTLSKSGLTRAVDRMEALGFIGRRTCPTDGRGLLVVLTPKGRQKLRRSAPEFFRSVARNFADHLSEHEIDAVTVAFERIALASRS